MGSIFGSSAHGDSRSYSIRDTMQLVLLGTDTPKFFNLLRVKEAGKALMVVTISQAKRLQLAAHPEQRI